MSDQPIDGGAAFPIRGDAQDEDLNNRHDRMSPRDYAELHVLRSLIVGGYISNGVSDGDIAKSHRKQMLAHAKAFAADWLAERDKPCTTD